MRAYGELCTLALRELDTYLDRLEELPTAEWQRPTRCTGWDVSDLTRHLTAVVWQQAEAFHRGRMRIAEQPAYLTVNHAAPALGQAMGTARAYLADAVALIGTDAEATVPLPFAPMPASWAAAAIVLEYGVHRSDLAAALHEPDALSADVADVVVELIPLLLPMLGSPPQERGMEVAFRLVADSATTVVGWRDGGWSLVDESWSEPMCELRSDDSTIALLALGRVPVSDPRLAITDPCGLASRFSRLFTGL